MALVVLLRKPPEHGSIVHIRFRAAAPVEEKEIAVTVNGDLPFKITQPAVGFSSASFRSLFSPMRKYFDASSMVSVLRQAALRLSLFPQ